MSVYKRLKALGLEDSSEVNLAYEEGCDVLHYTDDFIGDALSNSSVIENLTQAITEGSLYENGNSVLDEIRDNGLLDDYNRDGSFHEYVVEVIEENHWDYDWIEYHTERYDHKRGHTVFSFDFNVKLSDLQENSHAFSGWTAEVLTDDGVLTLEV